MNYERYGVDENPYQIKTPTVGDTRCFEQIHAFDEASLRTFMLSAIAEKSLAVIVIIGTSGSGRTAVARYMMSVFENLLRTGPQPHLKVAHFERSHDGNMNGRQVARDVLRGVGDEIRRLGAGFRDGPVQTVREEIRALTSSGDYTVQDLQSIAREFTSDIDSLGASFSCCIENVPNTEVFRAVRGMFEKSSGLLIFTIVSEQRDAVLGAFKGSEVGEFIELTNVSDDRACLLATARWAKSSAAQPLPFDEDGLKKAFHDHPRTVGKSLQTLAFMINSKLASYPGGGVHPADPGLCFDEMQIRDHIKLFDQVLK